MKQEIPMPKWGLTMEEGTIVEWLVRPGDTIAEGDIIASVATDKIDMDWESPVNGVVAELLAASGDDVEVGTSVLVVVSDPAEFENYQGREA